MALTLFYSDAFLKNRVTEPIETAAMAEIGALGDFPIEPVNWPEKLAVIRAYIQVCLDQGGVEGDVFEVKLKAYRREFDLALAEAQAAAARAGEPGVLSLHSVPLWRR